MRRGVQCFAIALAASAVLLGYRQAFAAGRARGTPVARVCVAGLRLDLSGGAAAWAAEGGRLVGDAICEVPGAPRGLPGDRLLAASGEDGGVIAQRVPGRPDAALEEAIAALLAQGWRETAPSSLARGHKQAGSTAALVSRGGFLVVTAIASRASEKSVVIAAMVREGEEGRR
jgi:hypothetical protein